jgi:hypothetical protein
MTAGLAGPGRISAQRVHWSRGRASVRAMSFDLYFLSREPGQSWDDVMEALEENAQSERPFDDAALATWERVKTALSSLLPNAEESVGERHRELTDEVTAIQVSMFSGELSLTVPYWHTGAEAERVVGMLRDVAVAVEEATGLTAYDPQADAPFLGEGEHSAAGTFDRTHASLAERVRGDLPADSASYSTRGAGRRGSFWSRFFERDRH